MGNRGIRLICALVAIAVLSACGGGKKTAAPTTTVASTTTTTAAPATTVATAAPTTVAPPPGQAWSGNGHHYLAVHTDGVISWDAAKADATKRGGHLATLATAGENAFVFDLVNADNFYERATDHGRVGPWIGGLQPAGSAEPASGWRWFNAEPFAYTNWTSGEPNDGLGSGTENCLHLFGLNDARAATWNDYPCPGMGARGVGVHGYIVEFDR